MLELHCNLRKEKYNILLKEVDRHICFNSYDQVGGDNLKHIYIMTRMY